MVKSDPITFATDEIGWYVVHVNANDIATMGAKPRWLLLTCFCQSTDDRAWSRDFSQVSEACQSMASSCVGVTPRSPMGWIARLPWA